MKTYLEQLAEGIRAMHGCEACYVATTPVTEVFRGEVAWQGEVKTFELTGHARAKRCYAWGYADEQREDKLTVVAVLEIPPALSPQTAVKAAIASRSRAQRRLLRNQVKRGLQEVFLAENPPLLDVPKLVKYLAQRFGHKLRIRQAHPKQKSSEKRARRKA